MSDEGRLGGAESLSLEEWKFQLERDRFELERAKFAYEAGKARGFFGFFNAILGFLIAAIVGIGAGFVSYLQLQNGKVSAASPSYSRHPQNSTLSLYFPVV